MQMEPGLRSYRNDPFEISVEPLFLQIARVDPGAILGVYGRIGILDRPKAGWGQYQYRGQTEKQRQQPSRQPDKVLDDRFAPNLMVVVTF